jgi:hypothetical protein
MDPKIATGEPENHRQNRSKRSTSATSVPSGRRGGAKKQDHHPGRYPVLSKQQDGRETTSASSAGSLTVEQLGAVLFAELRGDPATSEAAIRILTRLRETEARARRVCAACNQPLPDPTGSDAE